MVPKETSESHTDLETEDVPIQHPLTRQIDYSLAGKIKDPTLEKIPLNEPGSSEGGKYNLRSKPNLNYSNIFRY